MPPHHDAHRDNASSKAEADRQEGRCAAARDAGWNRGASTTRRCRFFSILRPTGGSVPFAVVHRLIVPDGVIIEHRVAIDVRAILVLLARAPKCNAPDGAAPDGRS